MDHDLTALLDEVAAHRYVELTTFRRTGEAVATPVWIARDGDELVVISVDRQGKTKRLAHTPTVELRPCDIRGRVPEDAPTYRGTAAVVREPAGVAAVKQAMSAKYLTARIGNTLEALPGGLFTRKPRAGIRIRLDAAG